MVVIIHSSICDSFVVPPSGGTTVVPPSGGRLRVKAIEWGRRPLPPEGGTTNFFPRIIWQKGNAFLLPMKSFDRPTPSLKGLFDKVGESKQESFIFANKFFTFQSSLFSAAPPNNLVLLSNSL